MENVENVILKYEKPCKNMFIEIATRFPFEFDSIFEKVKMSIGMKAVAISSVGQIKDSTIAIPLLVKYLNDKQPMIQEGALQAFENHLNEISAEELKKYLQKDNLIDVNRDFAEELIDRFKIKKAKCIIKNYMLDKNTLNETCGLLSDTISNTNYSEIALIILDADTNLFKEFQNYQLNFKNQKEISKIKSHC